MPCNAQERNLKVFVISMEICPSLFRNHFLGPQPCSFHRVALFGQFGPTSKSVSLLS
jgi:hypothetical protein